MNTGSVYGSVFGSVWGLVVCSTGSVGGKVYVSVEVQFVSGVTEVVLSNGTFEIGKYKAKNTSVWQDSNRLFCNEIGGPIFPDRPYKYLKEFFEKNNLVFKGLHSCRHSAISYLLHNNIAVPTVSRIAGHSNGNVTMSVYEHEIKEATVLGCDVMSKLINSKSQK